MELITPAYAAVLRQPYLQLVTPSSITIVWQTDLNSANNSRVQYGTVVGTLNQTALGAAVTSPVHGAEQRLIWNSRHGRVRF